jgi:hypothetical protein
VSGISLEQEAFMISAAFVEAALRSSKEVLWSWLGWSDFSILSIGRSVRPGAKPPQVSAVSVELSAAVTGARREPV